MLRCGAAGEAVSVPSFGGAGAFVSYPPLTNVHHELRVEAEFLPRAPDGLLLFSAGKAAPVEDFVALAMVGGHLEFRYELGSGRLARPDGALVSPGGVLGIIGVARHHFGPQVLPRSLGHRWGSPGVTGVPRRCQGPWGITKVPKCHQGALASRGSLGVTGVP